jgi:ABC-type glycerol-3-phosphate transport system substrate-binding protein
MGNFNKFQLIVLGSFVLFLVAGVASFALYKGNTSEDQLPSITIWGTFPKSSFDVYVADINNTLDTQLSINYVEKSISQFSDDFIRALARGSGPDAILIPSELVLPHEDKLALVPYTVLSRRDYLDTYIQQAQIYLHDSGIIGFPFMIDPLVMYWNRSMFDSAGIATYPKFWDEFLTTNSNINKTLTIKDTNGNIRKSAIAMGNFGNVQNAREILGTLLMQSGNPVISTDRNGIFRSYLNASEENGPEAAIGFFSQFSNPSSENYSWNRSMPDSKSAFLAGTLATYFGFASELFDIKEKNRNLNFDVALMPTPRSGGNPTTYGRMYGFSLVRTSPYLDATFSILSILSSSEYLKTLSDGQYLPNVRRDVLALGSNDPYIALFNRAALVTNSWLDPDPVETGKIMGDMIQYILSGQKSMQNSINDAGEDIDYLINDMGSL